MGQAIKLAHRALQMSPGTDEQVEPLPRWRGTGQSLAWRALAEPSAPDGTGIAVDLLGGMDHALARIAG
ncbi:MAG: hypothetical protein H6919_00270 [Sphingomonadaceae bacterium]|nr:hypothetical protein [Sphingomonadaceae bacterium]